MTGFKPMLAAVPAKIKYPIAVQAKLDGIRCSIVNGRPLSRTLKDIPNAEIRIVLSRPEFEGLDGELIVGSPTAPDCYRKTASFVMSESKTGADWHFYVFDIWNLSTRFEARFNDLARVVAHEQDRPMGAFSRLRLVKAAWVYKAEELEELEASYVERGHEGVIIRDPNGLYKFGRASATKGELLKLKRYSDFEAEVIGVYEEQHNANRAMTNLLGRTERSSAAAGKVGKGTLGGLILRRDDGVEFRCGSGFNAAERALIWHEANHLFNLETGQPDIIGRFAKVKSFPVGEKDKPRHPVFLGFRDLEVDG